MSKWRKFDGIIVSEIKAPDGGSPTIGEQTEAEQTVLDGVTAGLVTASKAVVVDANKDIGDFRNLDVVNIDAGASGAAGTVDVFPATASKGKFSLACVDQTGDTVVTLEPAAHGQATAVTIPDSGLATSYVMQSTAAITAVEADVLDGAAVGTQIASKAVVADANVNTGISKVTELHIGASGAEVQVNATPAELNQTVGIGGPALAGEAAGDRVEFGRETFTNAGTAAADVAVTATFAAAFAAAPVVALGKECTEDARISTAATTTAVVLTVAAVPAATTVYVNWVAAGQ